MSSPERATWIDGYAVDARSLAVVRLLFVAYLGVCVDLPQLAFVSELPADLWAPPPGPMRLFSGFPPRWFMLGLLAAIELLAGMVAVGWRTRASSIALALLLALAYGFSFCLGKINHNFFVWLTPLALSGLWGRAWSFDSAMDPDPARPVDPLPLALFALVVGFAMFSAGLPKLIGGWLDPTTSATYSQLTQSSVQRGVLAPFARSVASPLLWELSDWVVVLWESSFLLVVVRAGLVRAYLAMAVAFHVGVLLLFDIDFSANFVAYAALVPWIAPDSCHPGHALERRSAAWLPYLGLAAGVLLALTPPALPWLVQRLELPRFDAAVTMTCAATITALLVARSIWRSARR